jgi:hypothetical protein
VGKRYWLKNWYRTTPTKQGIEHKLLKNKNMNIKPNVKIGDTVLRRDRNGGEPDKWVECHVNETYLKLVNEFPDDYRQLDGSNLEMLVVGDV